MRVRIQGGIVRWLHFSVVTNVASMNAQANLLTHQHRSQQGAEPPVERLPHQHVGRRCGRPGRGEPLSIGRRDHHAGHPQRQRRVVRAPDQGRRAQQHLEPARSVGDAGDAVGVGPHHRERSARFSTQEATDLLSEIDREAQIAGLDADAGVSFSVFVSNDSGNETISSSSADSGRGRQRSRHRHAEPLDADRRTGGDHQHRDRHRDPRLACRARSERCRTGSSSR